MNESTAVAVHGAGGQMGETCLQLLSRESRLRLATAVVPETSPLMGQPVPGHPGRRYAGLDAIPPRSVVIDFSCAAALPPLLSLGQARELSLVSGVTDLSEREQALLDQAATGMAILWAPNLSLGVQVLLQAARLAARLLPDHDLEILEIHHRHKRDAPSGTALRLGEALAPTRPGALRTEGRLGPKALRVEGEIGFASLRGGGVPGDHTVFLLGPDERLELIHRAQDRSLFARGALRAALWLAGRGPGRYQLEDLFQEPLGTSD